MATEAIEFNFSKFEVEAFTDGDCWALAHAVYARTGWEVVAFGDKFDIDIRERDRDWSHMANRHPSGLILDITGLHSQAYVMSYWGTETVFDACDFIYAANQELLYGDVVDADETAEALISQCQEAFSETESLAVA